MPIDAYNFNSIYFFSITKKKNYVICISFILKIIEFIGCQQKNEKKKYKN